MQGEYFESYEDGLPVVQPLKTFDAVKKWRAGGDKFCRGSIALRFREKFDRPRMLACHDFKGGYQDDRHIQGSSNGDAYRFFHWHLIDEFIYFSHYFVTIPPPGWTNAAHLHGVPMYGTIITEWDEGKARCEEFLATKESYETFVDQLVEIAQYYRFDGWLINIENVIKIDLVPNLVCFVQSLTERMHEKLAHSKVIWYDSVTDTGELKWQNELNDKNSIYFAVCDGLFVNYTWKDAQLKNSSQNGKQLGRLHDIYFGVDVFGRGCRGGGGFNTKEALEAVHHHGLSSAIFAFGWVYETLGPERFTFNEMKFWSLLQPWCCTYAYGELPVSMHFCQGVGQQFMSYGKMLSDKPWSAESLQSMQPQFDSVKVTDFMHAISVEGLEVEWNQSQAFQGGSCLTLKGKSSGGPKQIRLCKLSATVSDDDLFIGLVVQESDDVQVSLEVAAVVTDGSNDVSKNILNETQLLDGPEVSKLFKEFETNLDSTTWSMRVTTIEVKSILKLEELLLNVTPKDQEKNDFTVNLGQVFIFGRKNLEVPLVTGLDFTPAADLKKKQLAGVLSWTCADAAVLHYRIFQGNSESDTWIYIGHSHTTRFQVELKDIGSRQVTFKVQPFVRIGFPVDLKVCQSVDVDLPLQ